MKQIIDLTDGQPVLPIAVQPKLDPNGGLAENDNGIANKMYDAFNGGVPLNYTYGGKRVYYGRKTLTNITLTANWGEYGALIDASKYILGYRIHFNDNGANNIMANYLSDDMSLRTVVRPQTNVLMLQGKGTAVKSWAKVEVEFEYIDR